MRSKPHSGGPHGGDAAPIVWAVAGTDSGGGAGLAADQRAADALGVHLCTVVAAITAQNSCAVSQVQAVSAELLDAQLAALADDMPPRAIKTGLLGSAANVAVLARWVDRLRQRGPLALVVDPVLRASTGASFADADLLAAYRELLLPRATVITPNRAEAAALVGGQPDPLRGRASADADADAAALPELARALRQRGAASVCITGGDAGSALAADWLLTPQASGWLSLPRIHTRHQHGTGCTFASALAAALALGHREADAAVLAKMATAGALAAGRAAGAGAGPVRAQPGFAGHAEWLPQLSLGEALPAAPGGPSSKDSKGTQDSPSSASAARPAASFGLYGIVDSADRVMACLHSGVATLQLRIKSAPAAGQPAEPSGPPGLKEEISRAIAAARQAGVPLYINDHWRLALALGADGVHLGQEDLLALSDAEHQQLLNSGLRLGLSSHSLWELCRASALGPAYIACGPVWPTETKQMPWQPQGLHNLAWWCAVAPVPVVAIGGILSAAQVQAAAASGASGVCVVRGLGECPADTVPALVDAMRRGVAERGVAARARLAPLPHRCL